MNAPKLCKNCPLSREAYIYCAAAVTDVGWRAESTPGPLCPFVKLDKLRELIVASMGDDELNTGAALDILNEK